MSHRFSNNLSRKFNQPNRRGTDPYARWCGRRETVKSPPIPIGSVFDLKAIRQLCDSLDATSVATNRRTDDAEVPDAASPMIEIQ